jgi:hypothetical protein
MGAAAIPTVNVPSTPAPVDAFGQMVQGFQESLLKTASRQGVGSTFLTGPKAPSALSGAYGPLVGKSALGGVV